MERIYIKKAKKIDAKAENDYYKADSEADYYKENQKSFYSSNVPFFSNSSCESQCRLCVLFSGKMC